VSRDPFWSVVRRRHPDVDIVLLPPSSGSGGRVATEPPLVDPVDESAVQEAESARLWEACVGPVGPEVARTSRWIPGSTAGTSRHETTWRLDGVEGVEATTAVQRGARVLADEGWHVLAPDDGMPRVLAGRGAGVERVELLLVHATSHARLVLRLRAAEVRLSGEEQP
jgi:hypothetical protein